MVPSLPQSNVYIKTKLLLWRAHKCNFLVGAKTVPTGTGLQTSPCHAALYRADKKICGNLDLLIAMVPCLHQSNVYIKRKLRLWRAQKCNFLVGAKTVPTGTVPQTTPFYAAWYMADNAKILRKFGSTYRHGTMFAPKQCLYQNEDTAVESPKIARAKTVPIGTDLQTTRCHKRHIGLTMEIFGNLGLPITMVSCLHQSNVYIKRKLQLWRAQKCNFLVGKKIVPTGTVPQTTPFYAAWYMADNENLRKFGSTYRHCTVFAPNQRLYQRKIQLWRAQKCNFLVGAKNVETNTGLHVGRQWKFSENRIYLLPCYCVCPKAVFI